MIAYQCFMPAATAEKLRAEVRAKPVLFIRVPELKWQHVTFDIGREPTPSGRVAVLMYLEPPAPRRLTIGSRDEKDRVSVDADPDGEPLDLDLIKDTAWSRDWLAELSHGSGAPRNVDRGERN